MNPIQLYHQDEICHTIFQTTFNRWTRFLASVATTGKVTIPVLELPNLVQYLWDVLLLLSFSRTEKCTWDHFETTQPLPPQSFGFAISDYFSNVVMVKHDLQMTVWTALNQSKDTAYISDILPKLIEVYEDYFDMTFPPAHLEYYGVPTILPYITSKMGIVIVP